MLRMSIAIVASTATMLIPAVASQAGPLATAVHAAQPEAGSAADAEAPAPGSGALEAAAQAEAAAIGSEVVVDALTTERTLVIAQPDGTMRMESSNEPVRVRQGDDWVPIDPSLSVDEDGMLAPTATTLDVRFSGGGSDVLAEIRTTDGQVLTERWPHGSLPTPVVTANSATYEDVLPDVDLRLAATATGMSEVFIVNTPAALDDPRLADLQILVEGLDLAERADGVIASTDEESAAEQAELVSNVAHFWDSSEEGASANGPGGAQLGAPLDAVLSEEAISLDVGAALAEDDLTYPVYVDPDWSAGTSHAWWINQAYPNQVYLDGGAYTDGIQAVGFVDAAYSSDNRSQWARAFWQMAIPQGKQILAAQFSVVENYAFSCTASPIELWRVDNAPVGGTWNSSPVGWARHLGTHNVAYGRSGCPAASLAWNVQPAVADVSGGSSTVTLGMKATNEGDSRSWKKFDVAASLIVTYNSIPNTPTALTFSSPSRACGTSAAPVYVNNAAAPITFSMSSTDPDAGNVSTRVYVVDAATLSNNKLPSGIAPSGYLSTASQAQGTQTVQLPTGTIPDGQYAWRAVTVDGYGASSPTSGWCYFGVKSSSPALPGVTARAVGPYVVGKATTLQFTSDPADKVALFAYWWVPDASVAPSPTPPVLQGSALPSCAGMSAGVRYACPDATGISSAVTVAPVAANSTLWVASYDGAGNVSKAGPAAAATPTTYLATADTTGVSLARGHLWPTVDVAGPLGATLADLNTGIGDPLYSNTPKPLTITVATVPNAVGTPLAGDPLQPVFDTAGYVPLNSFVRASDGNELELPTDTPPAGYTLRERLGWMLPPTPPGNSDTPGTSPVFRCPDGQYDMISPDDQCEGMSSTPTQIGRTWSIAMPAGVTGTSILRCGHDTATRIYDNCKGPDFSWGGFADTDPSLTASPITTSYAAVNAHTSFTVSAWLRPTSLAPTGKSAVALSQNGDKNSGFTLEEKAGTWRFCAPVTFSFPSKSCVVGPAVSLNSWQFVVGTLDATNKELRIYVGDAAAPYAIAAHRPATTGTNGYFLVGAGLQNSTTVDRWRGQIAHPSVFPGVADKVQRQNLYFLGGPN